MVLETGVEPQQDQHPLSPAEEVEPDMAPTYTGDVLFDKVHRLVERFAANRLGQFVVDRADRLLKIFEDTAKWSLPHDHPNSTLERPLSWLPFLLLIVTLRQVRWGLSVGALMIGNGPVTPHDMVYFIQTRRRKLRSIRLQGLKLIRQREMERNALRSGGQDGGFMVKLGKVFTIAICRPGYHSEPARRIAVQCEPEESQQSPRYVAMRFSQKRQREDDSPEADLTVDQLLSKYANENSEDDSDYMPNREDENNDETSTSATTHSSSEDTQGEYNMQETGKAALNVKTAQNANPKPQTAETAAENAQADVTPKSTERRSEQAEVPPPSSQAPVENGPSNGSENRDADVAQKRLLTPSTGSSKLNQLNGGHGHGHDYGDTQQRSTPGHESAAVSKPNMAPYFRNVTNATPNTTDTDTDDLFSLYPSNVPPSPSSTTSSSSLASFVTSDDFVVNEHFPDAPTPTPTATTTATATAIFSSSESPHLTNASSSEDIFSSPIGSPPTFNAFYQPESMHPSLKNPMSKLGQVDGHSTPKSADETASSEEPESSSAQTPKPPQSLQHPYRQQQQPNRYRNRNRR